MSNCSTRCPEDEKYKQILQKVCVWIKIRSNQGRCSNLFINKLDNMEKNQKQSRENFIKDIRPKSRQLFSSEQKMLKVMEALRGESFAAEICRKHGIGIAKG